VQGCTLNGQKTAAKTSEKVREFLIAKLNESVLGGKKANPVDVLVEMQDAKRLKGIGVVFTRGMENLTANKQLLFPVICIAEKQRGSSSYSRGRRESY